MALVGRFNGTNFIDIFLTGEIVFDNWEITEDNGTNFLEINNNSVNKILIAPTVITTTVDMNLGTNDLLNVGNITVADNITSTNGELTIATNTLVTSGGLVGIGTAIPAYPLDVVGDISTSTEYRVGINSVLSATTLGGAVANSSLVSNTSTTLTQNGALTVNNGAYTPVNLTTTGAIAEILYTSSTGQYNVGINGTNFFIYDNIATANRLVIDSDGDINNVGGSYQIGGVSVLSSSTLGLNIANSSLTTNTSTTLTQNGALTVTGDLTVDTNTLYVDSADSRLGVGTLDPKTPLHIVTGGATTGLGTLPDRGMAISGISANTRLYFEATNATSGKRVFFIGAENDGLKFSSLSDSAGAFVNENILYLQPDGNVGMGTATPTKQLDVFGTNASMIIRSDNESEDSTLFFSTPFSDPGVAKTSIIAEGKTSFSGSNLHFCLNNTADNTTEVSLTDSKMMILPSGNVGIGTVTPAYPLDVVGDISTSTEYRVGINSVLSSSTLGSGVSASSLTSLGTLTGLAVSNSSGSDITATFANTGAGGIGIDLSNSNGTGDSYIRFNNAGTAAYIVGNDQSSGNFSISEGTVLGTNELLTLTTAGNMTVNGNIATTTLDMSGKIDLSTVSGTGGSNRGIHYYDSINTEWGSYMASVGAGLSFSGGNTAAYGDMSLSGFQIRNRVSGNIANGFIWENSSETPLMGLNSLTGDLQIAGDFTVSTITAPTLGVPTYVAATIKNNNYNVSGGSAQLYMIGGYQDAAVNTGLEMEVVKSQGGAGWDMNWRGIDQFLTRQNLCMTLDHTGRLTLPLGGLHTEDGLANSSTRPSVATGTLAADYELRGIRGTSGDGGFLRLRAGGGTSDTQASFIDIGGYSDDGDMDKSIVFHTNNAERMRLQGTTIDITGTLDVSTDIKINGTSIPDGDITYLHMRLATAQTFVTEDLDTINWDTTVVTRGGITENTGVFTFPSTGLYKVDILALWGGNSTGYRRLYILHSVDGGIFNSCIESANDGERTAHTTSTVINITNVAHTILVEARQNSGTNLSIGSYNDSESHFFYPHIKIYRIGNSV